MSTHAVIDASGAVVNMIEWDGEGEFSPGADLTMVDTADVSPVPAIGWTYDGKKFSAPPAPAAPLPTVADYQAAVQREIDETALSKQFNDGVTMASYVNSTVAAWAAQATAFVAWRDAVWTYAYAELAKVEAETRTQPTVAEFLTELPVITWPAA